MDKEELNSSLEEELSEFIVDPVDAIEEEPEAVTYIRTGNRGRPAVAN